MTTGVPRSNPGEVTPRNSPFIIAGDVKKPTHLFSEKVTVLNYYYKRQENTEADDNEEFEWENIDEPLNVIVKREGMEKEEAIVNS